MTTPATGGPQAYVICTSPRSGSTLLCGLLAAAEVGNPKSYFHRPDLNEWRAYFGLKSGADDMADVVQAARRRGTRGGLFGLRLQRGSFSFFMEQLAQLHPEASSDVARIEATFGTTRFIHLTREDKLDQAISMVRAEMSGLWHQAPDGREIERLSAHQDPVYDAGRLSRKMAELTRLDDEWTEWFSAQGVTPLRLTYDALSADPRAALAGILKSLGRDAGAAADVEIPTAKLANADSRNWAQRYRAEHDQEAV